VDSAVALYKPQELLQAWEENVPEFTFVRHGRSLADDNDLFEGRYDSPLTDVGARQAERLCAKWQAEARATYDTVVSSPLARSAATAEILAHHFGLTVCIDDTLIEMDGGKLAGITREEGNRLYPLPSFCTPFYRNGAGTGESLVQLHARAFTAVDNLLQMSKSRYLVVAHGGILNAILRAALGLPLPVNDSGVFFGLGDLGYIDVMYDASKHRWTLNSLFSGMGLDV
jgi:2,3-bisphosphoglycerate-dependent phosphoglycerate mutase